MGGLIDLLLIVCLGLSICGAVYHGCALFMEFKQWILDKMS